MTRTDEEVTLGELTQAGGFNEGKAVGRAGLCSREIKDWRQEAKVEEKGQRGKSKGTDPEAARGLELLGKGLPLNQGGFQVMPRGAASPSSLPFSPLEAPQFTDPRVRGEGEDRRPRPASGWGSPL